MSDKRWPYAEAMALAEKLRETIVPLCIRCEIAGSLRRKRPDVGDIEILFIGKVARRPVDMFSDEEYDMAADNIDGMLIRGILAKRPSKTGVFSWGPRNKLSVHVATGIPVDWFATTESNWWNSLVCRTGGKQNNLLITNRANSLGWSFEAYGSGFKRIDGMNGRHETTSERDVYEFLKLPYPEPEKRL